MGYYNHAILERREATLGNYNFKRDLAVAKKTEQKIAELLTEKYGATLVAFDNTNKYDLLMDIEGILTSFEIKQDFMCRFTEMLV